MSKFYCGPNKKGATDEDIALDIIDKYDKSTQLSSSAIDDHSEYLKKYMGIADPLPDEKKKSGASNIFVPLMETHVDTVVAKGFLTMMGQDPFARFEPEHKDSVIAAKVMERVFNHYFYNKMKNSLGNMWLWFRNAVLYGTGVVHLFHDKDSHFRTRTEEVPNPLNPQMPALDEDGEPILLETTEEIVDYDGIRFEPVDLSNFAVDMEVTDWRKSWCVLREYVDPEMYLTRVETLGYKELSEEDLETMMDSNKINTDESGITNKAYDSIHNKGSYATESSREKIELLHYYGKGFINGVRQDVLYTVSRNKGDSTTNHVVLGPVPFGIKPFAVMRFKPNQDSFLGRGIGSQLIGLQDELNITRNQRIDNVAMELNGGWIYDDGSVEDLSQLDSRLGQKICKIPGLEVQKIPRQQIPSDAFNSEQSIQQDAQGVSASADILRGQSSRKETATTTTLLNNNAGQRLEAILMIAMEDGVQDFVNVTKSMIIDFSPSKDKLVIKLTEDEIDKYKSIFETVSEVDDNGFTEIPVNILDQPMHATAKISALSGDNRARSQELIQILQTLLPFTQEGWKKEDGSVETLDLSYFVKEFLRLNKYSDFKGIFQTLKTAEQAEQERQMALMQQAAQIESQTQGDGQQQAASQELGGQAIPQSEAEAIAQQQSVKNDVEDRAMAQ